MAAEATLRPRGPAPWGAPLGYAFRMQNVLTEIAGIPVPALAEQFGTPAYVYDQATIEQRITELRRFPTVRFAQKACSNLAQSSR